MAFKNTIKILNNQLEIQEAYIKITAIQIATRGQEDMCIVNYSAYKDKASADANLTPLDNYSDSFTPVFGDSSVDIKKQAYNSAKSKNLFPNAVDC